jgi:hypothetical protein
VQGSPIGTPRKGYDIVSAGYKHSDSGALVHKVNVRKRFPKIDDTRQYPHLNIDTDGNPDCEYDIGRYGPPPGVPTILNCGGGESTNVSMRRLDRNTLKFAFQPSEIGNPEDYGWNMRYPGPSATIFDQLPDSGFQEHDLTP